MGAWQEIVDYTVPSNTTNVVLDSFGTITKDDFVKVVATFVNGTSTSTSVSMLANSSVDSNYHTQNLQAAGSTAGAARASVGQIDYMFGSTTSFSLTYVKLSENDRVNYFSNHYTRLDSSLFINLHYTTSSGATFPSGITSLTFQTPTTNAIGTGSRIQIYKLAAEKVADITVASNTTQVDISNLSIDKDSEYLLVSDIDNQSGNAINYEIVVNDITTTTNYYRQLLFGSSTTALAERLNDARSSRINLAEKALLYSHIKLSNIGAYTYQSYGIRGTGTSDVTLQNIFGSSTSEAITSITKLNLVSTETNGIGAGSRFILYKLY